MENRTIPVDDLMLDAENPRHETVQTQHQAIVAVLEDQGSKLVKLAGDIAAEGLSPIDRILVVKRRGQTYTAIEGNRRLTAVKILHRPDLADGTQYENEFKKIAKGATATPTSIECVVAPSRDAARHWQELRHTGEAEGVGVVRWGALQTNRFKQQPGSQAHKAAAFIEAVRSAFPNNDVIQELLTRVGNERLTTLGRLVADPDFRDLAGLVQGADGTVFHYPAPALEDLIEQLLEDVAGEYSVTMVKTKPQRTAYLGTLPKPDEKRYTEQPQPLQPAPAAGDGRARKKSPKPRPISPGPLFKDLNLENLGPKVQAILVELRKLDLVRFPNASAVLLRAVVELAVDEFHAAKTWRLDGQQKLRNRVRKCVDHLDPTRRSRVYQGVRAGLQDNTSMLAVATLHAYVHNPNFHPTAPDLRNVARNYQAFLQALNDDVA